jgi:hypothetical protein
MSPPILDRTVLRRQILTHGGQTARPSVYLRHNVAQFGAQRTVPAARTIPGRLARPGSPRPKSTITTVGEAPDGFGKQVLWNAEDRELALVIFLSAADPYGVMISGALPTDTIEFVFAGGIASFSSDTENEGVAALIGIAAVGVGLGAAAFGAPEAKPLIDAAAAFAQQRFPEREVASKHRDAFGVDPHTGHRARAEGGVIISMPEAGQIFYSGNDDHQERWIKQPGLRDNAHRPDHVRNAYFLEAPVQSRSRRAALTAGDFVISAWDHEFADNAGFYRLHVLAKRGNGKRRVPPRPRSVE